jgi:beta-lactamase regulating signal transducer with metallopeptidase domain
MISALLDHLWQSTLFCGAVWAMTLALRGNRAAVRHGLWVAASVKFLVPFSALFSAGAIISFATPADADPPLLGVAAQVAAPVMTPALSIVQVAATPAPLLLNGLLALWIAGALLIAWRWFRAWRAAEAIARTARSLPGMPDDVRVSDADIEPAVARVFQPVVLLPSALLDRLEPEQLQAVLAHEREHIARRDNLTAHFQRLVEALFWFFPLVWWIGRRQVDERERACDEDVLDRGHDRAAYAEGILAVCRHAYAASSPATSAALSGDLTSRIRDILGSARPHALGALKAAALSIATIAVAAGPLAAAASADAARHRDYLVNTEHLLAGATIYIETSRDGTDPDLRANPDEIDIRGITLRELVAAAYDVPAKRVSGGGTWLDSPRYDIRAELPRSLDDPEQFDPRALRALTNKILASRFDLEIHVNQRCYSPCGRDARTANVIGR